MATLQIHCEHFNEDILNFSDEELNEHYTRQFDTLAYIWHGITDEEPVIGFEIKIEKNNKLFYLGVLVYSDDDTLSMISKWHVLLCHFDTLDKMDGWKDCRGGYEDFKEIRFYYDDLIEFGDKLLRDMQRLFWRYCYTESLQKYALKESLTLYLSAKLRFNESYCNASVFKLIDKYGLEYTIDFIKHYNIELHENVQKTVEMCQSSPMN